MNILETQCYSLHNDTDESATVWTMTQMRQCYSLNNDTPDTVLQFEQLHRWDRTDLVEEKDVSWEVF